jgi:hypothetical protein
MVEATELKRSKGFQPGHPQYGGRRQGVPPKKTVEERLPSALDAIIESVLQRALDGDLHAADILMRYYVRKEVNRSN